MHKYELHVRKRIRLAGYDYREEGIYFVTICTKDAQEYLWDACDVGAITNRPLPLSEYGRVVEKGISNIPEAYGSIVIDAYVIMPNHVHLLLRVRDMESGRLVIAPTISEVVRQLKRFVTGEIGFSCWQRSFHDHIVRNAKEYHAIWKYIENNPANWNQDRYYIEHQE